MLYVQVYRRFHFQYVTKATQCIYIFFFYLHFPKTYKSTSFKYFEINSKQIRMQFYDSDFPTMLTFGIVLCMQIWLKTKKTQINICVCKVSGKTISCSAFTKYYLVMPFVKTFFFTKAQMRFIMFYSHYWYA